MKENKTPKIIISILVIIILILSVLVGLLATDTISFTKESNTDNPKTNAKEDNKENTQEENKLLTNEEAKELIKKSYNQTIRDFFNVITYCGERTNMSETESQYFLNKYGMSYGFTYVKSANFKTFKELDDYLKQYATQNLLNDNDRYNKTNDITSPETGETVPTYVEKDGALYCNNWGKDGNVSLSSYYEDESTFEVTNITTNSITGKIYAVYYDSYQVPKENATLKTTLAIEVEVIKENDKWLLNHYKQVDEQTQTL